MARAPVRARGRQRVAALLEAAGGVFAEKGFDAATMTEIAARAGASIGSLYQFFSTKEQVATALVEGYAEALYGRLAAMAEAAAGWTVTQLAQRLARTLIEFRADHPAFATLVESPGAPADQATAVRRRLRGLLLAILQAKAPGRAAQLEPVVVAVQQVMKAAVAVNAEPDLPEREAAIAELAAMLEIYLEVRLG